MLNRLFVEPEEQAFLGLPVIDEEHLGIGSAMNSFAFFSEHDFCEEDKRRTLDLMAAFIDLHMVTEEDLMRESGFPEFEAHAEMHRAKERKLSALLEESSIGEKQGELMQFFREAWLNHMHGVDKDYVGHLRSNSDNARDKLGLYITWQDSYNSGINIIDSQHRGIVSAINSIFYYLRGQRAEEKAEHVFKLVKEYTDVHFKTEEYIQAASNYPLYDEHKQLHAELRRSTIKVLDDYWVNQDPAIVLKFLKSWWIGHIGKEVASFKEHGVGKTPAPTGA